MGYVPLRMHYGKLLHVHVRMDMRLCTNKPSCCFEYTASAAAYQLHETISRLTISTLIPYGSGLQHYKLDLP